MNFHDRFRELLNEYKENHPQTTQAQIASSLGLTPQAFSYYLNGREPNYETLKKLAKFFKVSVDYLIGQSNYKNMMQKANAQSLGLSNHAAFQLSTIQKIDKDLERNNVEPLYNVIESLEIILTSDFALEFFQNINSFFDIKKCKQINEAVFSACTDPNSELNTTIGTGFDSKYIFLSKVQKALDDIRNDLDSSSGDVDNFDLNDLDVDSFDLNDLDVDDLNQNNTDLDDIE